jgi:hypothetical protein
MLATKWMDYKTGKKKEKKRKKEKTSVGTSIITFVAQLVLGSNPKSTKSFKSQLTSTYELIHLFCPLFIDFGKQ